MFHFKHIKRKTEAALWQATAKHLNLNLIKKKLIQKDGFIYVYTDGSCNYKDQRLGTGVIIQTIDPTIQLMFSEVAQPSDGLDLRYLGAMKAEFLAATKALDILPKGTNVHIHTDHPLLRTVLRNHIGGKPLLWKPRTKKGHNSNVIKMVNDLEAQLVQKGEIQVTNLKDNQSRHMQMAHKAAAKGSGAKGVKKRQATNPPPTGENAFLMGDPRDSKKEPDPDDPITAWSPSENNKGPS
jgi:ribonuclease HI